MIGLCLSHITFNASYWIRKLSYLEVYIPKACLLSTSKDLRRKLNLLTLTVLIVQITHEERVISIIVRWWTVYIVLESLRCDYFLKLLQKIFPFLLLQSSVSYSLYQPASLSHGAAFPPLPFQLLAITLCAPILFNHQTFYIVQLYCKYFIFLDKLLHQNFQMTPFRTL